MIGGYTDPAGSRTDFGALLVGYYEDGRLRYAGKVGTGYSAATLRGLGARLRELEVPEAPFVDARPIPRGTHWIRPELVAQIGFAEWTLTAGCGSRAISGCAMTSGRPRWSGNGRAERRQPQPDFWMKLIVPFVSSTHHLMSASDSMPCPRASSAMSLSWIRSARRFFSIGLPVLHEDERRPLDDRLCPRRLEREIGRPDGEQGERRHRQVRARDGVVGLRDAVLDEVAHDDEEQDVGRAEG